MKNFLLLAVFFALFTIIGCKPILNDSPFCDSTTRPTNLKFDQSEYFALLIEGYYSIKIHRFGHAQFTTLQGDGEIIKQFDVEVKFCKSGKTEYSYMDIAFKDAVGKKLYFSSLIVPVTIKDKSGRVANLFSNLVMSREISDDLSDFKLKFPEVFFRDVINSPARDGHFTARNASARYISYLKKVYHQGYVNNKDPSGFIKEGLMLVRKDDVEILREYIAAHK